MNDKQTIYKCFQDGREVFNADSDKHAMKWLSENGGGILKNVLHGFSIPVKKGEKI